MHIKRRITCLCIGLLLCLTACRTGNSAPQQQEPVSTLPQAAYTPRPMPPPEGLSAMEGHMLWPVQRITGMSSYDGEKFRYAFINAAGEIVTSSDIIRFHYQRDENDRIAYLIASDEQRVYVYTLDGTKILDSPGENADVFPDEGLALITLRTADNYGEWNTENRMTVFSLSSGEPLLTGDYVHISQISGYTVLLIDTQLRQFACDLRQGENARVPLVGFLTSRTITNEPADWRLAAMTSPERYEEGDNLYGFVGPEGGWAVEPVYLDACSFAGDYAAVQLPDSSWTFIDRSGRQTAEHYTLLRTIDAPSSPHGILYETSDPDTPSLNARLQPVDPEMQKDGWIDGVFYRSGKAFTGFPPQYTDILLAEWPVIIARDQDTAYFFNAETGVGKPLTERYWRAIKLQELFLIMGNHHIVLDADGNACPDTVFDRYPSAVRYTDPEDYTYGDMAVAPDTYLWVTTASWQGYIDHQGSWLYRESRFQNLID